MLPTNLTTNEVKNAAGTEVEFLRQRSNDRTLVFAKNGELPNLQHRITVSHSEIGTGQSQRRRSVVRVDREVAGVSTNDRTISAYIVVDTPIGDIANYDDVTDTVANLVSLVASQGATTTILFDGTGYGAAALINGTL